MKGNSFRFRNNTQRILMRRLRPKIRITNVVYQKDILKAREMSIRKESFARILKFFSWRG